MKKIIISRDKKLASAIVPYWIIIGVSKNEFMNTYDLEEDLCQNDIYGQVIPRIDSNVLSELGIPIKRGQSIEIELTDDANTLFVCTLHGSLSNEIKLDTIVPESGVYQVNITTKGGWKTVSYPYIDC